MIRVKQISLIYEVFDILCTQISPYTTLHHRNTRHNKRRKASKIMATCYSTEEYDDQPIQYSCGT